MLKGQNRSEILNVSNGAVRLCEDLVTESYSIGIRTDKDFQWKYISKDLHDLLVKELCEQEGKKF